MKRGREYHSCRKNIKTGEKNIKWGKEEEGLIANENKDFKKWVWGKYQVAGNFIHPCSYGLFYLERDI